MITNGKTIEPSEVPQSDQVEMKLRVPAVLKKTVELIGKRENRSMNQQAIHMLGEGIAKMEQEAAL